MTELSLQGTVDDGATLLLTDAQGQRFTLPIDDSLFAAVRSDRARRVRTTGTSETIRPREIQAMIRSGMSAEEVAEATSADLEHVRSYEHPVLAERRHTATRAGQCLVYPENSLDDTPRQLAELVQERLALRDIDVSTTRWDAWKSQTGVWQVELTFTAAQSRRSATWEYRNNSVRPLDDEAKWLSDAGPTDSGPIPNFGSGSDRVFNVETENRRAEPFAPDDVSGHSHSAQRDQAAETGRILEGLRRRRGLPDGSDGSRSTAPVNRLHSVAEEPASHPDGAHTALGRPQDAYDDSVFAFPANDDGAEFSPAAPHRSPGIQSDESLSSPAPEQSALFTDDAPDDHPSLLDEPGVIDSDTMDTDRISLAPRSNSGGKDDHEATPKRKNGRASLPSWDEIMFGNKRD